LDGRLVQLGAAALVSGQTDSERVFALITAETARHGGDVTAGLVAAINWISEHLPVYSLNVVLSTATELWALRYPEANELWVLQRPASRSGRGHPLDAQTDRIHVRSTSLAGGPSVILASEPMDGDRRWRLLSSSELLHIAEDLTVTTSTSFPDPPAHQLSMSDLAATAAASQQATP
jgi:predicted glutamine amidotransferase